MSDLVPYKRTPTFTEETVPSGLLRDHRTKAGVYGRICVESGRLRYSDADGERVLEAGDVVVSTPERVHAVEPLGPVRFYVEFCRVEDGAMSKDGRTTSGVEGTREHGPPQGER